MDSHSLALLLSLFQQMCVYLVIAYLLSKTPLFMPLMQVTVRLPHKVVCYLIFSGFCIMGTYLGQQIGGAIANTRAIGAVLGGIMGGPLVGFAVGLTGGLHRYSLGGFTDLACAISTTVEGVLGGLVHRHLMRRQRTDLLFNPLLVCATALVAEILQMAIILAVAQPTALARELVGQIALPMMLNNSVGAALFMRLILDRKAMMEKYSIAFSAKALRIAERAVGVLQQGFAPEHCQKLAQIVREETGVGAVAITDCDKLLAFTGIGEDHHLPGTPISSGHTQRAIANNEVVYADGNEIPYRCSISKDCKLGSSLVIPLRGEQGRVIGTIKLYEPKRKIFTSLNRTLGEGIARLLSTQILAGKYEEQRQLLIQSEIKLLQAQVNPHFLFNALNTIAAVIRKNPERARLLVQHLSTFFRTSLKRTCAEVSLREELAQVDAYLQIELARFADRLTVDYAVPAELMSARLPAFTLQPLVENAIKYGTSQLFGPGQVEIGGRLEEGGILHLWVADNAGLFAEHERDSEGLGMNIVDRRIRIRHGEGFGIAVECEPGALTRVSIRLPYVENGESRPC